MSLCSKCSYFQKVQFEDLREHRFCVAFGMRLPSEAVKCTDFKDKALAKIHPSVEYEDTQTVQLIQVNKPVDQKAGYL